MDLDKIREVALSVKAVTKSRVYVKHVGAEVVFCIGPDHQLPFGASDQAADIVGEELGYDGSVCADLSGPGVENLMVV